MWTAPEIAELIATLDQHRPDKCGEHWLVREWNAPMHEHEDLIDATLPAHAALLGSWPRSTGILPPAHLLDQLNQRLRTLQRDHAEATGGPLDTIGIAVGIRQHDWLLACVH